MINVKKEKILIAYYSRKGSNYVNGKIINLPIGNTEYIAKMIQEMTKSDIFYINTVKPYPDDYTETTEVAKKEKQMNARPELTKHVEEIASYEAIILGYPNWWGTMPMAVFTFLQEYDFNGKTIIPFCTHEGSGFGQSIKDIANFCPKSTIIEGLAIKGSNVKSAQDDVFKWLRKLGLESNN